MTVPHYKYTFDVQYQRTVSPKHTTETYTCENGGGAGEGRYGGGGGGGGWGEATTTTPIFTPHPHDIESVRK